MLRTKDLLSYDKDKDGIHLSNPCGGYITDHEFLMHMIPHHQVAIDMSKEVMKYSTDPNILYLARNIIYKQTDEILFMESMLLSFIPNMDSGDKYMNQKIPNQFTVWYPKESRADNYQCGLHHFSTKIAKLHKLKKGQPFTDVEYMTGMVYHHDVAVEMSGRIMKYSKNPFMRTFANEIIKSQRYEIWLMKGYIENSQVQCSSIFLDILKGDDLVPTKPSDIVGKQDNKNKHEHFSNLLSPNSFNFVTSIICLICLIIIVWLIRKYYQSL